MDSSFNAASAQARLLLVAARVRLDFHLPSRELPSIAVDALEADFDSSSLRLLAGELHPTLSDSLPLFERALQELGIYPLSPLEAGLIMVRHYAEQILSDALTAYEGACAISDVADCLRGEDLWERLSIFIGLASVWQDDPDHRARYEQRIQDEARKLLHELVERAQPGA
jgi:hypothetical protein